MRAKAEKKITVTAIMDRAMITAKATEAARERFSSRQVSGDNETRIVFTAPTRAKALELADRLREAGFAAHVAVPEPDPVAETVESEAKP